MAICKCKMCGGDLNITELDKVVECEYCGTMQTVPSADSEKKMTLFNRANRLRLNNEFDKSAGIYESIIAEFPEEAEAYWGIVLCKYGIEYVDDPATGKKIPTCHRSSFDSVLEDDSFEQACDNADAVSRRLYREEAKKIEDIRKGIIEVSSKEEPYDIFICYKETDENGDRTVDSVIAQDVYNALTEKGYRVFFSRISLEDKLGEEYEPYIFSALNSAKIMLVFGTDYEYFNAVWVKNEWSRFLMMIEAGQKKTLIPCYKDLDAYDMPKEFAKLQAQDMGKVGAMQDLLAGIDKIMNKGAKATASAKSGGDSATIDSLLKRAFMFLEDGNFASADEYAEKVLDIDPENGEAYLAKAMSELEVKSRSDLSKSLGFITNANTKKALKYCNDTLKKEINGYINGYNKERAKNIRYVEERRQQIEPAQNHIIEELGTIGLRSDGTVVAVGDNSYGQCNTENWRDIVVISTSGEHTVGLRSDGTVVAVGKNEDGQCNTEKWRDIVAISAGYACTVGLRSDGTVVAVGKNEDGQCDTGKWRDIVAISASGYHTVGLCSDGTVVAVGNNEDGQCNTDDWRDIVAISTEYEHTVGLRSDGTVVAVGNNEDGQCDTGKWRDIVVISTSGEHTVGLRSDGTVVDTCCETEEWRDIVAISASGYHTVGLCSDGTVVAVGVDNYYGECDTEKWRDIVAISAGYACTVGLRLDGTVVAVGWNNYGQCNTDDWKLFDNYLTINEEREAALERRKAEDARIAEEKRIAAEKRAEEERIAAEKRAEELRQQRQAKIDALTKEKSALEAELPTLKGIFKSGKRKEVEARLAAIESELKKI